MITTISFELAKLLKEKGFKSESKAFYDGLGELLHYNHSNNEMQRFRYEASIIAEVIMWLYEKHGVWIYLVPAEDNKDVFKPFFRGKNIIDQHLTEFFNSPTEAYEAAIEYTLNNLI